MWRDSKFPLITPEADNLFFGSVQLRLVGEPAICICSSSAGFGRRRLGSGAAETASGVWGGSGVKRAQIGQLCGEKDDQWKVAHPVTLCRRCCRQRPSSNAAAVPYRTATARSCRTLDSISSSSPVFHDIADADDADKPVFSITGKCRNAAVRHQMATRLVVSSIRYCNERTGKDMPDRRVCDGGAAFEIARRILRLETTPTTSAVGQHQSGDVALGHQLHRIADRFKDAERDNSVAFVLENGFYHHGDQLSLFTTRISVSAPLNEMPVIQPTAGQGRPPPDKRIRPGVKRTFAAFPPLFGQRPGLCPWNRYPRADSRRARKLSLVCR